MRTNPVKEFTPAPQGLQRAVIVDVVDKGLVESEWEGKKRQRHVLQIRWQSEHVNPENKLPYMISQNYTNSLDLKATLRAHLESLFLRSLSPQEENLGVELEELIGRSCRVLVQHKRGQRSTYANVIALMPDDDDEQPLVVNGYTRVKDRAPEQQPDEAGETTVDVDGADIPF